MSVLSCISILKAVESKTLRITPFSPDNLSPASYDMRLYWKILVSPSRFQRGRQIDLRKEPGQKFPVEPGRFIGVLTEEVLRMPLSLSGRFGLRSEFTRHGLVSFGGIQIDPGYHGRLAISLFNVGPESIDMAYGKPMFTVEFHVLDTPADRGYSGIFQGLKDFHPVQRDFILKAHTVSLSEIQAFPAELSSLERRLAYHEASHQAIVSPLSVAEIAKAQGVEALEDLTKLAGAWPEDEDIDEFLAAVRSWRGR